MGDLHQIGEAKPRKVNQVEWTENGLRLSPVQRAIESDWFWPAILTFPFGAFLIVLFW